MKEIDGIAIGKRIQERRKKLGLSQTQFGERLCKNLRTIQKYEKGEIDLSFATLNEISKALGINAAELIGCEANKVQISSFADVLDFLFAMEKMGNLNFSLNIKRPPHHDEWECAIKFDGKDKSATFNQNMCLFLEEWQDYREDLADRLVRAEELDQMQLGYREWMEANAKSAYKVWQDKALTYYSKGT
ncbi:MAG: helix-turn-helix domain-containing protein [Defluviitaleaceae bacterium]|nr:helix-turn-helix domain-containing protein [Defluviitaleaceae bacterium]